MPKAAMTPAEEQAWLRGVAQAVGVLAMWPAGMTAKGILKQLGVTVEELRQAGALDSDIDAIERSRT